MAQIATLIDLASIAELDFVEPLPIGALLDAVVMTDPPDTWAAPVITNRFPTPPSAVAFLGDAPEEVMQAAYDELAAGPPLSLSGVLAPQSNYLEPTLGQIWPRIG